MRAPYCTGAFTPSGKFARVCVPHAAQQQRWARCSVTIRGCGSGRSNTCRAMWSVAIAALSASPHPAQVWGKMIDSGIGRLAPAQGLAPVPVLPARLLAGPFPQTADANRLLQAVAGRRFAAVATVQAKPAFQFGDPLLQLRDQGLLRGGLFPQCRNDGL